GTEQLFQPLQFFGSACAERMFGIHEPDHRIPHKAALTVLMGRTAGNRPEELPYPFYRAWVSGEVRGQEVYGIVDESVHDLFEQLFLTAKGMIKAALAQPHGRQQLVQGSSFIPP